jgi:hypothetical protein
MPIICKPTNAITPGNPRSPTIITVNRLIGILNPITLKSRSKSHNPTIPPKVWIITFNITLGLPKVDLTTKPISKISRPKNKKVMSTIPPLATASPKYALGG